MGKALRSLGIEIDLSGQDAIDELVDLNREVHSVHKGSKEFTQGLNGMEKEMVRAQQEAQGLSSAIKALGGLGLGAMIGAMGKEMVGLAADYEKSFVSFKVMLGSAEQAKTIMDDLNNFSNRTPYEPSEVIASGKSLMAFGVQAENVNDVLQKVGDVASGVGMSFSELSQIYGKNMASGRVQMDDINQLAGRGIPIMDELAKVLGVTTAQVREFSSKGKINFSHLDKAFSNMTKEGGRYFGMMNEQSKTAAGLWSTLTGKTSDLKREFGEMLMLALKPLLHGLIALVDWVSQSKVAMGALKTVMMALVVITPYLAFLGVKKLIPAIKGAATAFKGLAIGVNLSMWPLVLIVGVIAAVILAIEDLYTWVNGGNSVIGDWIEENFSFKGVQEFKEKLSGIFDSLKEWGKNIADWFKNKMTLANLFPGLYKAKLWVESKFEKKSSGKIANSGMAVAGERATGGPVEAGLPYLVGEQGPEIFTPPVSGNIIPNHEISQSSKSNITIAPTFNFSGTVARDDADSIAETVMNKLADSMVLVRAELGLEV